VHGRVRSGASLLAAVFVAACTAVTPSGAPSEPASTPVASPVTFEPTAQPSPTAGPSVRAAAGVRTEAAVVGVIWLGFEGCVGLLPSAGSPYLPPEGEDEFVLAIPSGWKVFPAHPDSPRYGDPFRITDPTGRVVAEDGDEIRLNGVIRPFQASFCGFGWPVWIRSIERVQA
jgi:hypothetical protein